MLRNPIESVEVSIRSTQRGPIITDALGIDHLTMSMQWMGLEVADTSYEALFRMNYANSAEAFVDALSLHVVPALNIFYADVKGNIGFQAIGKIPIRNQGEGVLPVLANDGNNYWRGTIPYEQMPSKFNPLSGYLYNANNDNTTEGYSYIISHDFAEDHRARRIEQLIKQKLDKGEKLTIEDAMQAQSDHKDLSVAELLVHMQNFTAKDELQRKAIKHLSQWQYNTDKNSIAATIYYGWLRHIREQMFADELKGMWNQRNESSYLRSLSGYVSASSIAALIEDNSIWCDNINTKIVEDCQKMLHDSLNGMLDETITLLGDDIEQWRWGEINFRILPHTPFSSINGLSTLFARKFPTAGTTHTLNVVSGRFDDTKGYLNDFGAGFRQIIEVSDSISEHYIINSTGQSGRVASPFYDDQTQLFIHNQYIQVLPSSQRQSEHVTPVISL